MKFHEAHLFRRRQKSTVDAGRGVAIGWRSPALSEEVPCPIAAVLFDKDGTLLDFDGTWGPAFHAMIAALAKGEESAMRAQAEALHFSLEEKRFRPTSPIIAGSSATYGQLWGEAIGRTDYAALRQEIDSLSAVESLKALTPIGRPLEALAALECARPAPRRRHQ